ncbi:MAG: ROK family transcriptional regulator [Chloroflexi bacterium]|nr:ROK family transcriptional regulator [Chloroflexota bacterium]
MAIKKATHQETKKHNRDLVLKTIFDNQTISRAEIARVTRLTRTTVSDVVDILLGEGLVEEVGVGLSIGGKSPILLSLVKDARYMISLNLAYDQFCGAIVNLRGETKDMISLPVSGRDGEQALALVYEILDRLLTLQWKPLVGIGVGTPGLINTKEGMVVNAVNLDWQNLPLANLLQQRYQLPVHVVNDSQAAAIGEFVYGGGYNADENLVVINVRQGIGAGILINGKLFQGDGGGAGEIGHVVVQENGLLCRCGKHGCLETLASARAVIQRVKLLAPDFPSSDLAKMNEIDLDILQEAFNANDPLAEKVINDAAQYLGLSIASLISTLNIQKFVLTGDMTRFGQRWLDAVREKVRQATLSKLAESTSIEIAKLDYRGCMLGASALNLLDGYSLLFTQEPILE